MTDSIQTDPAKIGEIAQKIVVLLQNETSDARHRAVQAAMMLLGENMQIKNGLTDESLKSEHADQNGDINLGAFFNRDESLKPSDHAHLCAAYHFSIYGNAPFTPDELREIAANAGVVLPDRIDMTLTTATRGGKKLFQSAGRGLFKPTASAGLFFKERWNVRPGRKNKDDVVTV